MNRKLFLGPIPVKNVGYGPGPRLKNRHRLRAVAHFFRQAANAGQFAMCKRAAQRWDVLFNDR